jgi:hypothetical protein
VLSSAVGCHDRGNTIEITLKGSNEQGSPIDMSIKDDADGASMTSGGGPDDDDRDIAPQFITVGDVEGSSSVSGAHCVPSPCPKKATIMASTPPPIVYAGAWKATHTQIAFKDDLDSVLGGFNFDHGSSDFTLNFGPPEYHDSGKMVMTQTGNISGMYSNNGASVMVTGSFTLQDLCDIQNPYYRYCGNTQGQNGQSNPVHRSYIEDTCPEELVKPYEADPVWDGHTLKLGDISINCRVTDGGTSSSADQLLCYRRTTTSAGGCEWDVHFATDGLLQAFAIAAFAKGDCNVGKACNTYR